MSAKGKVVSANATPVESRILRVISNVFKLKKFKGVRVNNRFKEVTCMEGYSVVEKALRTIGFSPRAGFPQHMTKSNKCLIDVTSEISAVDMNTGESVHKTKVQVIIEVD
jgi:hypothetical protein